MDALLTAAQVAARLQVAPRTLRRWRHAGGGPVAVKLSPGGAVRYRVEDVERFERDRRERRTHERAS